MLINNIKIICEIKIDFLYSYIKITMSKNKNKLYCEMIDNQLIGLDDEYKLKPNDILRICKYIEKSIFNDGCCVWKGSIANINNVNKGTYINFYFNKSKVILHRLLFINYVDTLEDDEYIKFTCDNKGICCNINHYKKYKYNTTKKTNKEIEDNKQEQKNKSDVIMKIGNLTIDFDC